MIRKIYSLYFSKDKDFIHRIRAIVGYVPTKVDLYKNAFFHRSSYGHDDPTVCSNERLEYLGDAILASVVADYLFAKYPTGDEGFLTKMRSKIVKRNMLNKLAEDMGLDILLHEFNQTRISKSMLGNAFEALVGAVYLEKGYNGARKFVVHQVLRKYIDVHRLEKVNDNFKSALLEYCQKNGRTVSFKTVSRYKQHKRDKFKMAVVIDGQQIATADAFNKKSAEQRASKIALKSINVKPNGVGA